MPALDPIAAGARFRAKNRAKLRRKRMEYHHAVMQKRREERLRLIAWMNQR